MPEDNEKKELKQNSFSNDRKKGNLKEKVGQQVAKKAANVIAPGIGGKVVDLASKSMKKNANNNNKPTNKKTNVGKNLLNNNTGIKTPSSSPLQKEKDKNENKLQEQIKNNAVRSILNVVAPGFGTAAAKVLEEKEKKNNKDVDSKKDDDKSILNNPLNKKKNDTVLDSKFNIQANFFKKVLPVLLGVFIIATVLIISVMPSLAYDNEFNDLRGVGGSGLAADVEGNADSAEMRDLYNRIITAKSDYAAMGITIRSDLIVAVYHVLSNMSSDFNEEDMTREVIDEIISYMFPNNCGSSCTYSKETFESNLQNVFFPKYLNEKQSKEATEEVFDYIERYREYIGYTGSDDSFGNLMCSDISLTSTSLSRDEFIEKVNTYANSSSSTSMKLFAEKAGSIYDISIQNNFNPEMVVIRAQVEGFSPGGATYNYYGLGCSNTGGGKDCQTYSSFDAGVLGYISNIKNHGYTTLFGMMSKYAYIGEYWYNPGGSGVGGCYYYPYINKYMSSEHSNVVANACAQGKSCSKGNSGSCLKTTQEDQDAYTHYQSEKMLKLRGQIFNISETDCTESGSLTVTGGANEVVKYAIATFDNYGYSQANRMSDSYVDCSSMVWRSYKHFGIQMGGSENYASTVEGIKSWCESNNKMISESELQPGDLVIKTSGGNHVELYIGNNQTFGAHTSKYEHDRQVSIVSYSGNYQYFCRPTK